MRAETKREMRRAIVLNAIATRATSAGPSSGKGGALTSRPSRSAASASVPTGPVSRRTAQKLSPAAAIVISTKASRKCGECHGRGGGTGMVTFSQPPSWKW